MRVLFDATVLCGALVSPSGVNFRLLRLASAGVPLDGFTTDVAGYEFARNAFEGLGGVVYDPDTVAAFLDAFSPLFAPDNVRRSGIGRSIIDQVWAYNKPVGEVVFALTGRSREALLADLSQQQRIGEHDFDPTDLHLVVSAVEHSADVICTSNTRDFKMEQIGDIRIMRPGALWTEATG